LFNIEQSSLHHRRTVQQIRICTEAQMSIQAERQKTLALLPAASCWLCDGPMTIKAVGPSMLASSLDEVVYRCLACEIERKQFVVKRASDT
jgi:hypothetical protein